MAIPETIKKLANDIRTKIYGREVREALAQGIEEAGNIADQANQTSNDAVEQVRNIQAQVDQLVVEGDSSVEAAQARVDAEGNVFTTLKERLDTKETQFANEIGILSEKVPWVSITEYGAKGDGVTNDYQAFENACAAAGPNGVVFFPGDENTVYYMSNGQTGTDGRIKMQGRPRLYFENPNITLNYYYDPDLKYLRALTPFKLKWGTTTKIINPYEFDLRLAKVGGQERNKGQVLTKLNLTADVTPENFNGTSWTPITGLAYLTADSMKFDKNASGVNLLMLPLSPNQYAEFLFQRDSSTPSSGHYDVYIRTTTNSYVVEFNPVFDVIDVAKWEGGAYTSIIASKPIPTHYRLQPNGSMFYGVKNLDNKRFEIYANGYLIHTITLTNETFDKVGFGHSSHHNNAITISYGLKIENYNAMKQKERKYFAFGDSITYGAYALKDYPTMVAEILYHQKGIRNLVVYNKGVSGDNSGQCLTRVNAALSEIDSDSIVTVQIGTNDCQGSIPVNTYISNMTQIIDTIRTKTNYLVVASFPMYHTTQPNYQNIALYNARLKQLCISKGVKFVDNLSAFGYNIDYLPDNIHPNEDGLLILAKNFADAIYELLNE